MVVIDTSIALAWCFRDEATEASETLLDNVKDGGAHVPSHWPLEVANVLVQSERRGRRSLERASDFIVMLEALPLRIDTGTIARAWDATSDLARRHRLTSYDAAYLELAVRLGVPLASRDDDLQRAARASGVELIPA